jgi:hypothetical protein
MERTEEGWGDGSWALALGLTRRTPWKRNTWLELQPEGWIEGTATVSQELGMWHRGEDVAGTSGHG